MEPRYALVPDQTHVTLQFEVKVLAKAFTLRDAISKDTPKLRLFGYILQDGWTVGAMPHEITSSSPKVFAQEQFFKSRWSVHALAILQQLWAKKLLVMYTGLPAKYYEYLVGMENGSAIMKYGAQIMTWTHSQFVALCAGNDPLAPSPLADEAVPLDPEVDPEPVEMLGDDDDNVATVLQQPPRGSNVGT